jgi:predicted nuclease with RNAse H fold
LFVGIDVGARRLDAAAVNLDGVVIDVAAFDASDASAAAAWCRGADVVAIDAPQRLSDAPHANDVGLAPKFRTARCAEIDLGRRHRLWVPWTTPTADAPLPGWMASGMALFAALQGAIEVFPYAAFHVLAGARLAPKQTPAGRAARARLLGLPLDRHSHHVLDALIAARTARDHALGQAVAVTCGHDGSAIWLPVVAEDLHRT